MLKFALVEKKLVKARLGSENRIKCEAETCYTPCTDSRHYAKTEQIEQTILHVVFSLLARYQLLIQTKLHEDRQRSEPEPSSYVDTIFAQHSQMGKLRHNLKKDPVWKLNKLKQKKYNKKKKRIINIESREP